jgi:hypothetical protein
MQVPLSFSVQTEIIILLLMNILHLLSFLS